MSRPCCKRSRSGTSFWCTNGEMENGYRSQHVLDYQKSGKDSPTHAAIPKLCCAHQLEFFFVFFFSFAQKLTTQVLSCCNAFWGNIYHFTMPGPPGELMTREK